MFPPFPNSGLCGDPDSEKGLGAPHAPAHLLQQLKGGGGAAFLPTGPAWIWLPALGRGWRKVRAVWDQGRTCLS